MTKRKQQGENTAATEKKKVKTSVPWKKQLKIVVEQAVFVHENERTIWVVLSPDVDGVLSYVFLREWAVREGIQARVVGEYNSKNLTIYENLPLDTVCERALFLDLDQHFAPHNIGQHFLGEIEVDTALYFNPNLHFEIGEDQYTSKYPFGTAHLMYWGLFEENDFPVLSDCGTARSIFVHADSAYQNCVKYNPNAKKWAERLFGSHVPQTLSVLLNKEYHASGVSVHAEMMKSICPFVRGKIPTSWETCRGFQSCRGTAAMFGLIDRFAGLLGLPSKMPDVPPKRIAWRGQLEKVERTGSTRTFLESSKRSVQSHAIVYRGTISATFGELVEVPEVSFF